MKPFERFPPGTILVRAPEKFNTGHQRSIIVIGGNQTDATRGVNIAHAMPEGQPNTIAHYFPIDPLREVPGYNHRFFFGGPLRMKGAPFMLLYDRATGPDNAPIKLGDTGFNLSFLLYADEQRTLYPIGLVNNRPKNALLIYGYSEWKPADLAHEVDQGLWRVCKMDLGELCLEPPERRWLMAARNVGFLKKPGGDGPKPPGPG